MSSTLVRLACIFVSISVAYCKPELVGRDAEWEVWKKFHGKVYENEYVETYRKAIWLANREVIRQHNKVAARNFSLGMNQLGDLTPSEYRHLMLGARYPGIDAKHKGSTFLRPSNVRLPDHVDWRTQGYVTPVKDQGRCGSCWAFSSTGSLEGQHFKKTGRLVSLSEQNLVDCCIGTYGNHGCQGGWMDNAFNYIRLNNGIDTEAGYPYLAKEQPYCYFQSKYVGATDSGYVNIMKYSEKDLQVAVATVGPISVAIDASHGSFQFYRSGVYYEAKCSTTTLDHAVLVVGYGTFEGQDYWLVKNSWGTTWGMNGYVMMARNRNNQCGIATAASYPLV